LKSWNKKKKTNIDNAEKSASREGKQNRGWFLLFAE